MGEAASRIAPAASASEQVTVTASPREGDSGRRTRKGVRSTGKEDRSAGSEALHRSEPEGTRGGDRARAAAAQPSGRVAQEKGGGVVEAEGVALGVALGVGLAVGLAVALAVVEGVPPEGEEVGVGLSLGRGVAAGVASLEPVAVSDGVGEGVGV